MAQFGNYNYRSVLDEIAAFFLNLGINNCFVYKDTKLYDELCDSTCSILNEGDKVILHNNFEFIIN